MKRTLTMLSLSLVTVILLAIAGAGIFLATLDLNSYKAEIIESAEKALGRKVVIEGNISHSLFPLGLRLDRVIIADDGKFGSDPFVLVSGVALQTDLAALLRGNVLIEEIDIAKVQVKLAIAANGKANWETPSEGEKSVAGNDGVAPLADDTRKEKPKKSGQPAVQGQVQQFKISELVTSFVNFKDKTKYTATVKGLSLAHVGLGKTIPLNFKGTVVEENDLRQVDFTYVGTVLLKEDGSIQANAAPLTAVISNPKVTAKKLELSLSVNTLFANNTLAINDMFADVANIKATGLFSLILPGGANLAKGRTLDVRGELAVKTLDVDALQTSLAYLTPASEMGRAPQKGLPLETAPVVTQGNKQPAKKANANPLASLSTLDANLFLTVEKLLAKGVAITAVKTQVSLLGGELKAPYSFGLSGGDVKGSLSGKLAKTPPSWQAQAQASGIQAGPLAATLANKKGIDGVIAGNANITGSNLEWPAIAPQLNGSAAFTLTKGYVADISFLPLEVTKALKLPDGLRIDKASSSFAIQSGVARTQDILVDSSLVTAKGKGFINLVAENLDLRVDVLPGGAPPVIPLIIDGSLYAPAVNLSARGLLEKTAKGIIESPQDAVKLLKQPKSIGKELKGILKRK